MVSVICTAYNHEKFIRDALEGMVNQNTTFKFEVIVHDDASTDHTADIIKEYEEKYPDSIRAIYQKENQFTKCHIYPTYLFPQVKGSYIAFCEGDDYWIDSLKLQKQVDFLESHKDYSMCMHNAIRLNYETGEQNRMNTFSESGTYDQSMQILAGLGTNFPAFASYVLRADWLKQAPSFFFDMNVVDYPIRQYYANVGKVYYFQECMSVYRVATPSSYMKMTASSQSFYNKYTVSMIRFFEQFDRYTDRKYHKILKRKIISDYWGYCSSVTFEEGKRTAVDNGLNLQIVEKCCEYVRTDFLHEDIARLAQQTKHLYIYGTSRLAMINKKQLDYFGVPYDGYVVSDGQMKPDEIDGKRVYFLREAVKTDPESGFILAVQPVNVDVIKSQLNKYHITKFCEPYAIESYDNCQEET